jgi:hypothetical protein
MLLALSVLLKVLVPKLSSIDVLLENALNFMGSAIEERLVCKRSLQYFDWVVLG